MRGSLLQRTSLHTRARLRRSTRSLLWVLPLLLAAGCQQDPFAYVSRPDQGATGDISEFDGNQLLDGRVDGSTDGSGEGGCKPTGDEVCDNKDNDCNGTVDDVPSTKLQSDAQNCGKCGNICTYINAFGKCVSGSCAMDSCAPGYFDKNQNWTDGCEYQCMVTNGGVEECPPSEPDCACDNADNDCDGLVDEVFDTTSDINNCGACGVKCLYNHAAGKCTGGTCSMGPCEDGYADLNLSDKDGCEYGCPVWPTVAELCNGKDDDCDKQVDEGNPGSGVVCDTGLPGECKAGTTQCQGGTIACVANHSTTFETCNGKDDDCDGQLDEDFNLNTSTINCGTCGTVCSYANGVPVCDVGVCKLDFCMPGYKDLNALPSDGCEHQCQVWPPTAEKCNGKDDDCDKQVDEDFDHNTSIEHCGVCNNACTYPNAQAQCVSGTCQMGNCNPGYHNVKNGAADGCEYFCTTTNNGVEICDNADNDCDGLIDDGFNLAGDVNNCGTCNNVCSFNNAAASCLAGKCVMGACATGFKDLDGLSATGCEYKCPVWPALTTDLCDGVDNDCDKAVDENFVPSACGPSAGECVAGTNACIGGSVICQGGTGPTAEICDNKDNDCDSQTDEDFDKLNDPRYCGANCIKCSLNHAIAKCSAGVCAIAVCAVGWVDLDKVASNGCEYACTVTGVEICDGIDNDCNGKTDTADAGMSTVSNFCAKLGACATPAATPTCQGSNGWVCGYGPDVQLRSCTTNADCTYVTCTGGVCPGELALEETRCDGKDNDCDGLTDEPFVGKGSSCAETGKQGVCQGTGYLACNAGGTALYCNLTTPGSAASDEKCNGLDDDCDGLTDEEADDTAGKGVVDAMVHINRTYNSVSHNFWIYTYEASRPDAKATSMGNLTTRACSKASVLPWGNLTYAQALAACTASGKRLCTADEWYMACAGATNRTYPYGNTYQGTYCNGHDNDPLADAVVAVGSETQCLGTDLIYDMSGNLKEWTNDQKSTSPSAHTVRGGGYDSIYPGLRCDFTFAVMPDTFYYPNLGFRCCSNTAP